jgi:hypothetical protein
MKSLYSMGLCFMAALLMAASVPAITLSHGPDMAPARLSPAQDDYPRELMQEDTFDVGAGGNLHVDVYDADVEVLTGAAGGATVQIYLRSNDMDWARGIFAEMEISTRLDGNTVVIETTKKPSRSWWSGTGNRWFSLIAQVQIPEEFDIDISTGDGDVSVDNLRGQARIHTADGDISVARLEGPAIVLETSDGDVEATSLIADRIEIDTSDGDIDVGSITGPVKAKTSDGDIYVKLAAAGEASFRTGDGDVRIEISQAAPLDISTGDGDIDIVAPRSLAADVELRGEDVELVGGLALEGSVRDGRAQGRINGGGPLIKAETGDGEIRLVTRNQS